MKNTFLKSLSIICGTVVLAMTGCGPTTTTTDTIDKSSDITHEVNYYDGEKVLHTQQVGDKEKITEWDPTTTIVDKDFFGWYAEPTLTHEFDFDKVVEDDVSIFGAFVAYKKDTRKWGIAGSGATPILKASNWGKVFNEEHYLKNESTDKENIFTITLDLFEGDQFQFTDPVIKDEAITWGHQRGGKYLVNPIVDDVEYFSVGGGLGSDNYTSNITANVDGNYKFTLHTYPAGDFQKDNTENTYDNRNYYDKIVWERLGDTVTEKPKIETTLFMKGAQITSWGNYVNDHTKMVETDQQGVLALSNVYLKASDEFLFASQNKDTNTGEVSEGNVYVRYSNLDEESKAIMDSKPNMNMVVKETGYYTFTYTVETTILNIKKVDYTPVVADYYFDGSFCGWKGVGNDTYKFAATTDNPEVYTLKNTVTLKENDEIGIQYYDVDGEDGKKYIDFFSASYVVANENFDLTTKNNAICKVAGEYQVTFNVYSHLITLTLVEA